MSTNEDKLIKDLQDIGAPIIDVDDPKEALEMIKDVLDGEVDMARTLAQSRMDVSKFLIGVLVPDFYHPYDWCNLDIPVVLLCNTPEDLTHPGDRLDYGRWGTLLERGVNVWIFDKDFSKLVSYQEQHDKHVAAVDKVLRK